jgi:hypothetical protein
MQDPPRDPGPDETPAIDPEIEAAVTAAIASLHNDGVRHGFAPIHGATWGVMRAPDFGTVARARVEMDEGLGFLTTYRDPTAPGEYVTTAGLIF